MSSNSIFSSVESERRWVMEVDKNFDPERIVDIDLDNATCVFRVPKSLSERKPEAYAPQQLGLGPYHHGRAELYVKQKQKFSAVKNFLGKEKLQNLYYSVVALIESESVVRACYDQYLDFDIGTLARILAIDAIYLLQLLAPEAFAESEGDVIIAGSNEIPINLVGDMMMLENQIPFILLNKTLQILQLNEEAVMSWKFGSFVKKYSPLKLNQQRQIVKDVTQSHLLHRMYYLIVTNRGIKDPKPGTMTIQDVTISIPDVKQGLQFLADREMPGAAFAGQILSFMENVPWNRILALFKKGGSAEDKAPSVEEIDIPTVSQMSEAAGIKFKCITGGIRDIKYDDHNQGEEKEEKVFYLPQIRVDANTEVILRNLVAYEAAIVKPGSILELAVYVDLLCGIVDTPKDVKILKTERIVESELPDEEIARIFNGIGKSTKKNKEKSDVQVAIDSVNESYHNLWSVKLKEPVKKYGYASWKVLSVLITIAALVLIILNAFCSVFGCGRWFGKETTTQIHNLLLSDQ